MADTYILVDMGGGQTDCRPVRLPEIDMPLVKRLLREMGAPVVAVYRTKRGWHCGRGTCVAPVACKNVGRCTRP